MSTQSSPIKQASPGKRILLGLLAAVFATNVIDVFAPLLAPEIAATFGISTGSAIQLPAFSALAAVVTALALSAFSIRVNYKTLLTAGVLCIIACVIGVYFAPNFLTAQIFYALNGVGSVTVSVMTSSLIGELYPLEKKAVRVSWVMTTASIATLVGSPITGFIASTGGVTSWRNSLLWFMTPATIICALLVVFAVPSVARSPLPGIKKEPFLNGFKQVFTNKSAVACLLNSILIGAYAASAFFPSSFLKNVYGADPSLRGMISFVATCLLIAGFLTGGFLAHKIGRKRLTMRTAFIAIIFSVVPFILSVFISNIWLYLSLRFIGAFVGGMPIIAGANLLLEQVPKYRGTVMSLSSAFGGIGGYIGITVGGSILNLVKPAVIGFATVITLLATLGTIGTLLLFFFARDPIKNPCTEPMLQQET